jgi:ABC-type branched-subunit amino acid transport system ATPase component
MFSSLRIQGFRGFEDLTVQNLGRVNLLVGTNNCGKSSILEAVQMLASSNDPSVLWQVAARRGERLYEAGRPRGTYASEVDVAHFFYGHEIRPGCQFSVTADSTTGGIALEARVIELSQQLSLFDESGTGTGDEGVDVLANWGLEFHWPNSDIGSLQLKLSGRGGISTETIRRSPRHRADESHAVRFIATAGLTVDEVVSLFEEVVLTKEEDLVIEALRTIEPNIDRIATMSGERARTYPGERGGIVVKCRNTSQRVPIGSMGDGLWRMLGLALAIATAEGGVLLVDEIDTGLHFTVMDRMWKLVDAASRRLSVQVFATTHSRDCYESLAAIARSTVSDGSEVTIQRIDRGRSRSVAFTEQEIVAAASRGTEVR